MYLVFIYFIFSQMLPLVVLLIFLSLLSSYLLVHLYLYAITYVHILCFCNNIIYNIRILLSILLILSLSFHVSSLFQTLRMVPFAAVALEECVDNGYRNVSDLSAHSDGTGEPAYVANQGSKYGAYPPGSWLVVYSTCDRQAFGLE